MKKGLTIIIILFTILPGFVILAQEKSPYEVKRLSFNLPGFSDISPVIVQDGIMFCSDRRLSGVTDRTSFDNRRLYSIYIAEQKDTSDWRKPSPVKSDRTSQFNTGPLCISPDGETVYFTSEIETGVPSRSRKFRNHSGIFTAQLAGLQLNSIKPFKFNSQEFDIGQPSMSPDGRFLYFASDMPGGQGGSDIYFCESVNGEWSAPVNLGPKVNSPGADNYPCIHSSGKLYFTSNRPGGMGGLDVYYSDNIDGVWETPVRLPEPINSNSDDFAFVALPDLQKGYFSSNRRRNDDIYELTTTIIRKTSCNPLELNNYCYEFVEENAVKYDSIPFSFEWRFGDGRKAIGRIVEHCYDGPGKYLVQLDVTNLVTKEVKLNEKSEMLLIEDVEQPYITCPDNADAGSMIRFSADSTNLPGWDISQY
ncbi:MAG: PKD domain-containing protein [Bacteroidia bacterium]|nr:MAG: PKD domain-containing protein [Bacteroidia bacterium]